VEIPLAQHPHKVYELVHELADENADRQYDGAASNQVNRPGEKGKQFRGKIIQDSHELNLHIKERLENKISWCNPRIKKATGQGRFLIMMGWVNVCL
jgi:hypothetical protein